MPTFIKIKIQIKRKLSQKIILFFYFIVIFCYSSYADMPIGINISWVDSWASQLVFVDVFKQCQEWSGGDATGEQNGIFGWKPNAPIPMGNKNYPSQIPYTIVGSTIPQIAQTVLMSDINGRYPSGTYTLMYEGTGRLLVSDSASGQIFYSSGTYQVNVSTSQWGVSIVILESNISDPIRNIKFIMPGYVNTWQSNPFYPGFTDKIKDFKVFRFMDWFKETESQQKIVNWNDRKKIDNYTQSGSSGVAMEYMIMLANNLQKDVWINIPYAANDDYVRECARLWRDNLNTNLKIYIEYTNETFTTYFPGYAYSLTSGVALGLDSNPENAMNKFTVKRSLEIFRIFEQEFSGTERIVKIITGLGAYTELNKVRLNAVKNSDINPYSISIDIFAIGPYFGGWVAGDIGNAGLIDSITVEEILDRLEANLYPGTTASAEEQIRNTKALTDANKVKLIAYEGGQHLSANFGPYLENTTLTNKLAEANRHPRMYDIYMKYFQMWFEIVGNLFINFTSIIKHNKYGAFGMMEYIDQSEENAPKYRAIMEVLHSSATVPTGFSGKAISSSAITWSWNSIEKAKTFIVYNSSVTDVNKFIFKCSTNVTSWTQDGLSPNTSSSMYIRSYNVIAGTSASSANVVKFTLSNPPANTYVISVSSVEIFLSWSSNKNPSGTMFDVQCSSFSNFSVYFTSLTFNSQCEFRNLQSETTYYLRTRSYNNDGIASDYDMTITTMTSPAPSIPVIISTPSAPILYPTSVGSSSITWTWNDVSDETGYRLKTSIGGVVADLSANTSSYQHINLLPNTSYSCYIESYNTSGSSASSVVNVWTAVNNTVGANNDWEINCVQNDEVKVVIEPNTNVGITISIALPSETKQINITQANNTAKTDNTIVPDTIDSLKNTTYEFKSSTASFEAQVTIVLSYKDVNIPLNIENNLRIFKLDELNNVWSSVAGEHRIDKINKTVSVKVWSFSVYRIFVINTAVSNLGTILVYPNPSKSGSYVTFQGLTQKASIKIYNVAGELVFMDEKDNVTDKYRWELKNKSGTSIASGIYIYYISNTSGEKKTGKIGIVK